MNKIDQSIQLLKKLQVDYNVFESIAPDLDNSVQSKIHLEIHHMDRLLNRITDLNSEASDRYEEKRNEILLRNAALLAELEQKICEQSEAETRLTDEINSFMNSQKVNEPGGKELLAGLENSLSNVLNGRMELVLARDGAQSQLLKELADLDGHNEVLLKEIDVAVKEVTEHEFIYQNLVTEVLKLNESKRENLLQRMKDIRPADVSSSAEHGTETGCDRSNSRALTLTQRLDFSRESEAQESPLMKSDNTIKIAHIALENESCSATDTGIRDQRWCVD